MSTTIYIFLPADEQPLLWMALDGNADIKDSGNATLDELAALVQSQQPANCDLIIPSAKITAVKAQAPNRNPQTLKALPWQLEEQLAGSLESVHISIHGLGDKDFLLQAVDKNWLADWQQRLQSTGIPLRHWLPLQLLDNNSAFYQQGYISFNNEGLTQSLSIDNFCQWAALHPETLPDTLSLGPENIDQQTLAKIKDHLPDLNIITNQPPQKLLDLSGDFALYGGLTEPSNRLSRQRWYWPVAAAAILLTVYCGQLLWHNHHLQQQKLALDTAIESQFRQRFPDVRRIINVRHQASQQLALLNQSRQGSAWIRSLERLAQALPLQEASIKTANYQQDQSHWQLQLSARDQAAIQRIEQQVGQAQVDIIQQQGLTLTLEVPQ